SRIRDLEESDSDAKEEIINLGLQHGLASSHTSFVAVEEKAESPKTRLNLHSSMELPAKETKSEVAESTAPKNEPESKPEPSSPSGKRVYDADFLMRFQPVGNFKFRELIFDKSCALILPLDYQLL